MNASYSPCIEVPSLMKAVLLTGHGGPEKLVYRDDIPVPRPTEGEILIRVTACGVNNTDIWVREGAYGTEEDPYAVSTWRRGKPTLVFPRIQGADPVGQIVAVGPGVSPERIGQRVIVDFSIYNTDTDSLAYIDYMGHGRDGGFAEYMTLPAENAHEIISELSDPELATFCVNYLTGEHMLNRVGVGQGERVLITGASGGVGTALIQLCRARGAIPYAIVSPGKEKVVRAIGAEAVVTRGTSSNMIEDVEQATNGYPIDVVADVVVGPMFKDLLRILRQEGRYITAGAIAGPIVTLDMRTIYLKHLQIHGSSQGTRKEFRQVVDYIEAGAIKPQLAGIFPLSKIHDAQREFLRKRFVGKLVVVPDTQLPRGYEYPPNFA
jgi:alcohol dehydrogenase